RREGPRGGPAVAGRNRRDYWFAAAVAAVAAVAVAAVAAVAVAVAVGAVAGPAAGGQQGNSRRPQAAGRWARRAAPGFRTGAGRGECPGIVCVFGPSPSNRRCVLSVPRHSPVQIFTPLTSP